MIARKNGVRRSASVRGRMTLTPDRIDPFGPTIAVNFCEFIDRVLRRCTSSFDRRGNGRRSRDISPLALSTSMVPEHQGVRGRSPPAPWWEGWERVGGALKRDRAKSQSVCLSVCLSVCRITHGKSSKHCAK